MPVRDPTRQDTILVARERLERTKAWILMLGCGGVIGGALAVARPFVAATVFSMVLGLALLTGGGFQTLRGMLFHRWRPRIIAFRLASGITACAIAVGLLAEPHAALAGLGLALSTLVIAHGAARLIDMLRQRDNRWWLWGLVVGLLVATVAGILALGWPDSAVRAFGTLGGLALFFAGWWLIMLATSADSHSERELSGRWPR